MVAAVSLPQMCFGMIGRYVCRIRSDASLGGRDHGRIVGALDLGHLGVIEARIEVAGAEVPGALVLGDGVDRQLPGEARILGGRRLAVGPRHALADVEGPRLPVGRALPAVGEARDRLEVRTEVDQQVVAELEGLVADDQQRGVRVERIEILRRPHPDHDLVRCGGRRRRQAAGARRSSALAPSVRAIRDRGVDRMGRRLLQCGPLRPSWRYGGTPGARAQIVTRTVRPVFCGQTIQDVAGASSSRIGRSIRNRSRSAAEGVVPSSAELGQDPPEDRRELEAVRGPEGDQDARCLRERGRPRSRDRGSACTGRSSCRSAARGRPAGARSGTIRAARTRRRRARTCASRGRPAGRRNPGRPWARPRRRSGSRRSDGSSIQIQTGKRSGAKAAGSGQREVGHLLLGDGQRQPPVERREQLIRPRVGGQHHAPRPIDHVRRDDLEFAATGVAQRRSPAHGRAASPRWRRPAADGRRCPGSDRPARSGPATWR